MAGGRSLGGVPPLNWLSKAWKRVSLPRGRVQRVRVYRAVYWERSYSSSHENVSPDAESGSRRSRCEKRVLGEEMSRAVHEIGTVISGTIPAPENLGAPPWIRQTPPGRSQWLLLLPRGQFMLPWVLPLGAPVITAAKGVGRCSSEEVLEAKSEVSALG